MASAKLTIRLPLLARRYRRRCQLITRPREPAGGGADIEPRATSNRSLGIAPARGRLSGKRPSRPRWVGSSLPVRSSVLLEGWGTRSVGGATGPGGRGCAIAQPLVGAGRVAVAHFLPAGELVLERLRIHAREDRESTVGGTVTVADRVQLAGVGHPGRPVGIAVSRPPLEAEIAFAGACAPPVRPVEGAQRGVQLRGSELF